MAPDPWDPAWHLPVVPSLVPAPSGCVTLGQSLILFKPPFSHLQTGDTAPTPVQSEPSGGLLRAVTTQGTLAVLRARCHAKEPVMSSKNPSKGH